AFTIESSFEVSLRELFKMFLDLSIINAHYASKNSKKTWENVVAGYRNVVFHEGYFSSSDGRFDIYDIIRYMRHIHDILLRFLFKKLNYDGHYLKSVRYAENKPIDRVDSTTSPYELGFD